MKKEIRDILINIPGWHTTRRLVVIESDDWGATRMASKNAYQDLNKKGFVLNHCPYNFNDRIESNKDLEDLGNVLISVKDKNQNPAKFTLNNIMANPDFEKIEQSNFNKYYFESFERTLEDYDDTDKVIKIFKSGIKEKIFKPQLHGREHLNVRLWMQRLKMNDPGTHQAFDWKMYTINHSKNINGRRDNLDAFGNSKIKGDFYDYNTIISEAQDMFFKLWGFKSHSFIAPCYTWHPNLEEILYNNSINFLQGTHVQKVPLTEENFDIDKKYHYTGHRNSSKQTFLVRNVFFEPTEKGTSNAVQNALTQIRRSFRFKKPAIISSHRVNYIGTLNPKNREQNLRLLNELLLEITKEWPDVEFLSSDELGQLIVK